MARLSIASGEFERKTLDLHFGRNTFGRAPENHWQIADPSISSKHCEISVEMLGVFVRDCDSTNGTYLDGRQVQESALAPGQRLRMGQVEFIVEDTSVPVAIPKFDVSVAAPPVVLDTGAIVCPEHPEEIATHQCTHCRTVMCMACVHNLHRRGGKDLLLCPHCSHPVMSLTPEKKKKRSLLDLLHTTVKLPSFKRHPRLRTRRRP